MVQTITITNNSNNSVFEIPADILSEPKDFAKGYLHGKLKKRKQIRRALKINICFLKQLMKTGNLQ